MDDKRRHQRYHCSKRRNFIANYENSDGLIGEVVDFSRSGICIDSNNDLTNSKAIRLVLQFLGLTQQVPASVEIVWSKPKDQGYTYGAKFTDIDAANKFDILDILYKDWLESLKSDPVGV